MNELWVPITVAASMGRPPSPAPPDRERLRRLGYAE